MSFDVRKPCKNRSGFHGSLTSKATLAGHRYRLEFLRRLREHIDLDLYGRGFAPIEDKWQALAPYRYSIAFENAAAPYYFTEKIMDCTSLLKPCRCISAVHGS